jgi:hypothetical protein
MYLLIDLVSLLAQASTASDPPEVKYNVAFIAAVAAVLAALISAVFSMIGLFVSRRNQSVLQRQQADLARANNADLENLKAQLTLSTQRALEAAKVDLMEGSQSRLESLKADLTSRNQQSLESFRAALDQQGKERDARRDYEYDAHKRLYTECEPLIFQLADLAEHAYYRIYSLARTARRGDLPDWLRGDGYYMRSTMYKLVSPLLIFRLIQQRLTFVDLTLDARIASQYRLLKSIYLTFTDAFEFANLEPRIDYDPDVSDWKSRRGGDPRRYWRQGMSLGALDNAIDALLEPGTLPRWKTYGEFESEFKSPSDTRNRFLTFFDILYGFHPRERPVFWRMLWAQSFIYKKILESQSDSESRVGLAAVSPRLPEGSLDWRRGKDEAPDEEVFAIPERVAQEYLRTRLPEVFGEPEVRK